MFSVLGYCDDTGRYSLTEPKALGAYIRQHLKGKDFVLTVKAREDTRSNAQNRWLFGVALPLLMEHLGYDRHEKNRLHYDLLAVRFGTEAIAPLLPGAPPRIEPKRTSSQLTVAEFSDYMDWLCRYAAQEFGVVLPLPGEEIAA